MDEYNGECRLQHKDYQFCYYEDWSFCQEMSEKTLKRSKELFDAKGAMEYILNEMELRELWF